MNVDPRFTLSVEELDSHIALRLAAAADLLIEEAATNLFSAGFNELAILAGLPAAARPRMVDPMSRTIFSNGWQSWSYAGELAKREFPRRAMFLDKLNLFTDSPGPKRRPFEVLSHFFTYIRGGDWRLMLVSRGLGAPDRPDEEGMIGPPVSFRIDRRSLVVKAEILAPGARFVRGERIAELRLFAREGFFAARDALREVFQAYRHFDRLAFLSHEEGLVPGGFESWYNHYANIDENLLRADLLELRSNKNLINEYYLRRGKPTVFQVDDGWQRAVGDWEADAGKFPSGMAALAREIDAAGLIPGLWLAPFAVSGTSAAYREHAEWLLKGRAGKPLLAGWNPGWGGDFYTLDLSLPAVEEYLAQLFERVVNEWGFRYLKLDFLYVGLLNGAFARNGAPYQHYDRVLRHITSRVEDGRGRPVAWLGCGAPLEPSFRHFPLMRIGADTRETWEWPILKRIHHEGRPAAYTNLLHTIGRSILDTAVFVNDPDVLFCREKGMGYGEREKELIALVDGMLASQIMFSDDAGEFGAPGEEAFTTRIITLFDRLAKGEYGAERLDREVFRLFSRDGLIEGFANLRDRAYRVQVRSPRGSRSLRLEPRSITLEGL